MNYDLIKEVMGLVKEFDAQNLQGTGYSKDVEGFKNWIAQSVRIEEEKEEPNWEGKINGRSPESTISTLIVHLNRYARSYSKSAIYNSEFSTQEDFIYLINLKAFGAMTKMELIKKNIQEKSVGIKIINRLIKQGWIDQTDSEIDKRSKLVHINAKGLEALERQMDKVRQATNIVSGDLTHDEKMELIGLLNKLNDFHHPIYLKNINPSDLLNEVTEDFSKN